MLKPLWQFTVRGTLWRVTLDSRCHLVGEERDVQQKRTSYFCLECGTGAVRWRDRRFGEDWWIGIEACSGGVLYLHGYATPDLPGHRGIIAVDVRMGEVLWADEQLTLLTASQEKLYAVRSGTTGNQVSELDPRSGKLRTSYAADDRHLLSLRSAAADSSGEAAVPIPLPEGKAGQGSVVRLVWERSGSAAEMIRYIDHPATPVITSSVRCTAKPGDAASCDRVLEVIYRDSGDLLFTETLSTDTRWPVEETVFLLQDTLYYVKDQKTLAAVSLRER